MRKVVVVPFDESWLAKYELEATLLTNVFKDELVGIHHIGSTAIKGLNAKPVIDILPVVKNIDRVNQYDKKMTFLGYEPRGEYGLPGRRYFQKGGDVRTHHVHIYEAGNPEIERHLAFRDYLRAHPQTAEEYGKLKEDLSLRFPFDIQSYLNGKDTFVKEVERKAMKWYKEVEEIKLREKL